MTIVHLVALLELTENKIAWNVKSDAQEEMNVTRQGYIV